MAFGIMSPGVNSRPGGTNAVEKETRGVRPGAGSCFRHFSGVKKLITC